MSLDRWPPSRLRLTRTLEAGMSVRRLDAAQPRGTIFYIHGLGESALCFEALLSDPRLADWSHVAPDLLGYGRSSWPGEPLSVEEHAARLVGLVDRLDLDDIVLLGHSMGGVVGLYLARSLGRRIRCFINVEGNVTGDDCKFSSIAAKYTEDAWLRGGYGHFVDRVHGLSDGTEKTDSLAVVRAYAASVYFADPRTLLRNSSDLVRESESETLARRLGELEVPIIYLYGKPRGTGGHSLDQLDKAGIECRPLEPAGHWPFLDQHDSFVEALVEILDYQAGSATPSSTP